MAAKTSWAATKDRPERVALQGAACSDYSNLLHKPQSNSGPEVVVYRRGRGWIVAVANKPWGWPNLDRECFDAPTAERYAARVRGRLAALAKKEAARRQRHWEAVIEEGRERLTREAEGLADAR